MFDFFKILNKKTLLSVSIVGILSLFIYLFISFIFNIGYKIYVCIPLAFFVYLLSYSKGLNNFEVKKNTGSVLIISFMILFPIDLAFQYHYDKNDFIITKGYIYESKINGKGKGSSGYVSYYFKANKKLWSGTKNKSIWYNLSFKDKDSIYVVYSKSNPDINDIYLLSEIPEKNPRKNLFLYIIKNLTPFDFIIATIVVIFLVKYLFGVLKH